MPATTRTGAARAAARLAACADYTADEYDANGDGVFNLADYACDTRVEIDPAEGRRPGRPARRRRTS